MFGPVLVVKTFSSEEQVLCFLFFVLFLHIKIVKTFPSEEHFFLVVLFLTFSYIKKFSTEEQREIHKETVYKHSPRKSRHYIVKVTINIG